MATLSIFNDSELFSKCQRLKKTFVSAFLAMSQKSFKKLEDDIDVGELRPSPSSVRRQVSMADRRLAKVVRGRLRRSAGSSPLARPYISPPAPLIRRSLPPSTWRQNERFSNSCAWPTATVSSTLVGHFGTACLVSSSNPRSGQTFILSARRYDHRKSQTIHLLYEKPTKSNNDFRTRCSKPSYYIRL